jgi:5-methylcytosine-specific restriction endonuclease McrA
MTDRSAYQREWYLKNKERHLAKAKSYRVEKSDQISRQKKQHYEANKQKVKESQRRYRSTPEFKALTKEIQANYRARHRDTIRVRHSKWVKANPERDRAAKSKWQSQHPEIGRIHASKRRALKRGARVNIDGISDWMALVKSGRSAICYYCKKRISIRLIHFDHIVALSRGGPHSIENLCVSCSACNLKKGAKAVKEWMTIGQQIMEF